MKNYPPTIFTTERGEDTEKEKDPPSWDMSYYLMIFLCALAALCGGEFLSSLEKIL